MSQDAIVRKVRLSKAKKFVQKAFEKKRPVFLWGAPGIGKSELMQQITEENNGFLIDLRLPLLDPTDIKGYPYRNPETNSMEWATPAELPTEEFASNYDQVVLFLDELNAAPPAVQASAYQLVLNRRVGQYQLPDNVVVVAAGNRESDKGVTYKMPSPLENRFLHFELEVNFEDWQQWAINNNVNADVIGYLSANKQDLFDFDPKSSSRSFATPRSWTFVSELISDNDLVGDDLLEMVASAVGEGMAVKFMTHKKFAADLPNPVEVLEGNITELKVKEISANYALTVSLCYELKEVEKAGDEKKLLKYVDNFLQFTMKNFETEMNVLAAITLFRDYDLEFDHYKVKSWDDFSDKYIQYWVDED